MEEQSFLFRPTERPFPEADIPRVIYDRNPEFAAFYDEAWRLAWTRVYESEHLPRSPYMSEGCRTNRIWIWDSCLMLHFCLYSPAFPSDNTLDNFYDVMAGNGGSGGILVHHPDNPPLFAWTELRRYRMTGDLGRVRKLIAPDGALVRHYERVESFKAGERVPWGAVKVWAEKLPHGYLWGGLPSGMDNTPRGGGVPYEEMLWFDLAAQQGLAALSIARLAEAAGDDSCRERFLREYQLQKALTRSFWDERDGAFYDRRNTPEREFCRVLTPASLWPFLAEMGTEEQLDRMAEKLLDPALLGGLVPFPSVSRSDPGFDPHGGYWRGGVWLPLCYMGIKALEKYGRFDLARTLAERVLIHMKRTFDEYEPHTIWECYSPTEYLPSTSKRGYCRPDFCGWSALGPISLLIEDLIGIYDISVPENTIRWRLSGPERHGVANLSFGSGRVSLVAEEGRIEVESSRPLQLEVNGVPFVCPAGRSEHRLRAQE